MKLQAILVAMGRSTASVLAGLALAGPAAASTHVVDGVFAPGDPTVLQFNTVWSHNYSGEISFTGADLVSADIVARSESRANGHGSDPRPTYPLEIGCSATVGGSCLPTPFFATSGLSLPSAQKAFFGTPFKEELYANYRVNNPTYPGIFLSPSFGEVSSIVTFVFASGAAGPISYHLVYRGDAIPEPAAWAMMLTGFGLAGAGIRSRRRSMGALD